MEVDKMKATWYNFTTDNYTPDIRLALQPENTEERHLLDALFKVINEEKMKNGNAKSVML